MQPSTSTSGSGVGLNPDHGGGVADVAQNRPEYECHPLSLEAQSRAVMAVTINCCQPPFNLCHRN